MPARRHGSASRSARPVVSRRRRTRSGGRSKSRMTFDVCVQFVSGCSCRPISHRWLDTRKDETARNAPTVAISYPLVCEREKKGALQRRAHGDFTLCRCFISLLAARKNELQFGRAVRFSSLRSSAKWHSGDFSHNARRISYRCLRTPEKGANAVAKDGLHEKKAKRARDCRRKSVASDAKTAQMPEGFGRS